MEDIEEIRRKRIEENNKRMNELNLPKLSHNLNIITSKPKKQQEKKVPKNIVTTVRKSIRNSHKSPLNYSEYALGHSGLDRPKRSSESSEDRAFSIKRAVYLESTLGSQFPTFVRSTCHIWQPLPRRFCQDHMPDIDTMVMLIDEDERKWELKYRACKGLSSGWSTFYLHHQLRDGDALVFQLTEPTSFKVYIIRVESFKKQQDKGRLRSHDEAVNATELRGTNGTKRN